MVILPSSLCMTFSHISLWRSSSTIPNLTSTNYPCPFFLYLSPDLSVSLSVSVGHISLTFHSVSFYIYVCLSPFSRSSPFLSHLVELSLSLSFFPSLSLKLVLSLLSLPVSLFLCLSMSTLPFNLCVFQWTFVVHTFIYSQLELNAQITSSDIFRSIYGV